MCPYFFLQKTRSFPKGKGRISQCFAIQVIGTQVESLSSWNCKLGKREWKARRNMRTEIISRHSYKHSTFSENNEEQTHLLGSNAVLSGQVIIPTPNSNPSLSKSLRPCPRSVHNTLLPAAQSIFLLGPTSLCFTVSGLNAWKSTSFLPLRVTRLSEKNELERRQDQQ